LVQEILEDCSILEEFQFDEIVEFIAQLLPYYYPNETLDNEHYFSLLMHNINSDSLQHICYCLNIQRYSLVNRSIINLIKQSVSLPKVSQVHFWKIIYSHNLKVMTVLKNEKVR